MQNHRCPGFPGQPWPPIARPTRPQGLYTGQCLAGTSSLTPRGGAQPGPSAGPRVSDREGLSCWPCVKWVPPHTQPVGLDSVCVPVSSASWVIEGQRPFRPHWGAAAGPRAPSAGHIRNCRSGPLTPAGPPAQAPRPCSLWGPCSTASLRTRKP